MIQRYDLTTNEEANVIIIRHCYKLVQRISSAVKIISDDTDACALAYNYFLKDKMDIGILMEATKSGRTVTHIGVIVRKHESCVSQLCP